MFSCMFCVCIYGYLIPLCQIWKQIPWTKCSRNERSKRMIEVRYFANNSYSKEDTFLILNVLFPLMSRWLLGGAFKNQLKQFFGLGMGTNNQNLKSLNARTVARGLVFKFWFNRYTIKDGLYCMMYLSHWLKKSSLSSVHQAHHHIKYFFQCAGATHGHSNPSSVQDICHLLTSTRPACPSHASFRYGFLWK